VKLNSRVSNSERLQSIDALRGIAALGVVLYHIVGVNPRLDMKNPLARAVESGILKIFSYGYVGVFLFFVISGFCIHLQHAKAEARGRARAIDFKAFWRRRLRRLYPPYIIALALYLVAILCNPKFQFTPFFVWDVASHLLMLHNLDPRTVYSINGVFWTLAIEEQLYLAYFLLLAIRKRLSWRATLLICFAARVAWFYLMRWLANSFGFSCPVPESAAAHWFTWALGALAVENYFGLVKLPAWCRNFAVGVAFLAAAVALAVTQEHIGGYAHDALWLLLHPIWGLGFFVLLNCAVHWEIRWREKLNAPRMVLIFAAIGVFSYSLYLTHQIVLSYDYIFHFLHYPVYLLRLPYTLVKPIVSTPLCIFGAWIFFRLFERPFLTRKAKIAADQTLTTTAATLQDAV
jgi:peptidoglycan/LPS O-acetylase OafA/YrhL